MTKTATLSQPAAAPDTQSRRVPVGAPVYNEIVQFLFEEALLLDELKLEAWLEMLAPDLVYTAPLRITRSIADLADSVSRRMFHFEETFTSLMGRVGRLTKTKAAWAEDPPSRTRRLITNVLVSKTDEPAEFAVSSYLLLARSRFEDSDMMVLSCVRNDVVRKSAGGFRLARREIIIDQSVLGMPNLAVFL